MKKQFTYIRIKLREEAPGAEQRTGHDKLTGVLTQEVLLRSKGKSMDWIINKLDDK